MALFDNPTEFILRMFEMETREGRGEFCRVYPKGTRPGGLPLGDGELIYGTYKNKYHFTPDSLILEGKEGALRIGWSDVVGCSTKHGSGNKRSTLRLADGSEVVIQMSDLAKGWSGRISQLFHGMIDRFGRQAAFGLPLLTIGDFFDRATKADSFAVNAQTRISLEELRKAFEALSSRPDVDAVFIVQREADGEDEVYADRLLVVTESDLSSFAQFVRHTGAAEAIEADPATVRQVAETKTPGRVIVITWE